MRTLDENFEQIEVFKNKIIWEQNYFISENGLIPVTLYLGYNELRDFDRIVKTYPMVKCKSLKGSTRREFMGMEIIPVHRKSYIGFGV